MATSPTSSIGGLASGLDTATIVSQLMQLEAAPQTQLKNRLSTEQSAVKVAQALNAQVAALGTLAATIAKASTWSAVKATSSTPTVAVTAGPDATPGTMTFTVDLLAAAHRLTFSSTAALGDVVTGASTTVNLTSHDGTVTALDTGDGTLTGLVAAINASGKGVYASTVALDGGQQRLRVESLTTGATSDFTLTRADGSALLGGSTVRAGADAAITLDGDTIHSSTNSFTGVLPGVNVTLGSTTAVGQSVDIGLTRDSSTLTAAIKGFVDAVNGVIATVTAKSAWDATTKTSGPLSGDPAVRALRNDLIAAIYPSDGSSMAQLGIQLDRSGSLVFDATAFETAYAKDPASTKQAFTSTATAGLAERVGAVAKLASHPTTGTLTASITGSTSDITRMQKSIDDWDLRLELRRTTLNNQFTALETAMSKMKGQSDWLTSQLSQLSSSKNG